MRIRTLLVGAMCSLLVLTSVSAAPRVETATNPARTRIRRVLLISVDGLHALDLQRYVAANPGSAMAALSNQALVYTRASAADPADSFPGLLAMLTGGSPASTGVYYDDSYDRSLSPAGSNCATTGTEVAYDESIDLNPDALDGGGGIDPTKLPLDPANGCSPVYPHQFLRVNTIFEVAKAAGLRTAWADKHPAYEIVNGPSGKGVDDLYVPEIAADGTTNSVAKTEAYDDLKVQAVLNEINGTDHTGARNIGTPAIFGMNFQAVSVAQKLKDNGYADALGAPSAGLNDALTHVDSALGQMVAALQARNLYNSTLVIVTAKHGQSPIEPSARQLVSSKLIPGLVEQVQTGLLGQATQDTAALIWLTDQSKTNDVVGILNANASQLGISDILAGDGIRLRFGDPASDPRVPDVIVRGKVGVIYASATASKIAEHGGFSDQDTNVALIIANPQIKATTIKTRVQTTQIAPTILQQLGLRPQALQAVRAEQTQTLPGLTLP